MFNASPGIVADPSASSRRRRAELQEKIAVEFGFEIVHSDPANDTATAGWAAAVN
jgi:hypothetical protein